MKYSVIKRSLDLSHIEDYGQLDLSEIKELAKTFIPEVFKDTTAIKEVARVIKVEGCDDWFVPGPAVVSIRAIEE